MTAPQWPAFYESVASAILTFVDDRHKLFDKIQALAARTTLMDYLKLDNPEFWETRGYEIDPFTIMGVFNRAVTVSHRQSLAKKIAKAVGAVDSEPPEIFHGIPYLDPRHSIFSGPEEMWNLAAVARSDAPWQDAFVFAWDKALELKGNGASMLSIGLFWWNPVSFMALDKISEPWIESRYEIEIPHDKFDGDRYVKFLKELREKTGDISWAEISLEAWQNAKEKKE
ncbi:MAG: hypothetical protein K2H64_01760 [Desulfovibrio sp.]|nr:hypothetical protein [Desulfovibrio sp.]